MPLSGGARLGPYEILGLLGAGGMGEVYRARDPRLGRSVALKVLPVAFTEDAERLRRFAQEARSASALNHPGIISIYDLGVQDGLSFLVFARCGATGYASPPAETRTSPVCRNGLLTRARRRDTSSSAIPCGRSPASTAPAATSSTKSETSSTRAADGHGPNEGRQQDAATPRE